MNSPLQRFTQPDILTQIGRNPLRRFTELFGPQLKALNISLPNPSGDYYFLVLAERFEASETLPAAMLQALLDIEQFASPQNRPRLQAAIAQAGDNVYFDSDAPPEHDALQLWLYNATATPTPAPTPTLTPSPAPIDAQPDVPSPQPTAAPLTQAAAHPNLPPDWDMQVEPCPQPVDGGLLLDDLRELLTRFVVLPKWAPETLALWILHTYAFELRDVTTYLGIESPVRRCGKTTLLTLLSRLVNRPVVAANVSSSALFRAIQQLRPTLLIDEADTFIDAHNQLRGILNAGYNRPTAYVLRVGQQAPQADSKTQSPALAFFSAWCPKAICRIGRLPDTLADRCIVLRMQRKTPKEQCERLRKLEATPLRQRCARFVLDHSQAIAQAKPDIPTALNDRAADIWEPLLALADLAGGRWPQLARQAALGLSATAAETNPIGSLLLDILMLFSANQQDRLLTRELLEGLNTRFSARPWMEARHGSPLTDLGLSNQLRPFGIAPRTLRIGHSTAKGYLLQDFDETFRRYIPISELLALHSEPQEPTSETAPTQSSQPFVTGTVTGCDG